LFEKDSLKTSWYWESSLGRRISEEVGVDELKLDWGGSGFRWAETVEEKDTKSPKSLTEKELEELLQLLELRDFDSVKIGNGDSEILLSEWLDRIDLELV